MRTTRYLAIAAVAALLAGCGGGASSTPPTQTNTGGSSTSLAITIKVPGKNAQTQYHLRKPLYTSADTKGIGVEFQASSGGYSGAPSASPTFAQNVAAGATNCTSAAGDGSFSCTVYIPGVSVGYHDFRIALWNAAPTGCAPPNQTGCSFSAVNDRVLSFSDLTNYAIVGGIANALSFTLLPVVDSVAVSINGGIVDGTLSAATAYLTLKDAAGDIILGSDQLVDSSGNNVTVGLSIGNDVNDSGAACGTQVAPSTCAIAFATNPSWSTGGAGGNSVALSYDGNYAFPTSGSLVPTVSASLTAGGPISGTNLPATFVVTKSQGGITVPGAPQYKAQTASFGGAASSPALLSDGNIYVVHGGTIAYFTPCGTTPCTVTSVTTILGPPGGLAAGTDGQLWYTDTADHKIVHQPAGASGSPVSSAAIGTDGLGAITPGPDGNMWFIDTTAQAVDSINPNTLSVTPHVMTNPPVGNVIAAGTFADGHQAVCTADTLSNFWCYDITAATLLGASSTCQITAMTFAANGTLYAGCTGQLVEYQETTGPLGFGTTYFPTLADASSTINGMVTGADDNVWFTESGGTLGNVLGRVSLGGASGNKLEEWTSTNGVQFPASTTAGPITSDASGNLWIANSGGNTMDEVAR